MLLYTDFNIKLYRVCVCSNGVFLDWLLASLGANKLKKQLQILTNPPPFTPPLLPLIQVN